MSRQPWGPGCHHPAGGKRRFPRVLLEPRKGWARAMSRIHLRGVAQGTFGALLKGLKSRLLFLDAKGKRPQGFQKDFPGQGHQHSAEEAFQGVFPQTHKWTPLIQESAFPHQRN